MLACLCLCLIFLACSASKTVQTAERTVCAMMYNIKDYQQIGDLRLMRFDPVTRSIEIETYSPYQDQHYTNAKTGESVDFVIEDAF